MDLDAIETLASEPEYSTLDEFILWCISDEKTFFTHLELRALALNTKTSGSKVRALLEGYGLVLASRPVEKKTRGFTSNSHNLWAGNPCAGGSGQDNIQGFAGRKG